MPDIDSHIPPTLSNPTQETACYATLDLQYDYSQLKLRADTATGVVFI